MSDKKILHLFYVPFTGLGNPPYRGDRWLENRIEVFKRFVLPSLVNQTNRNFTVWFQWRPEEAGNPIVTRFKCHLSRIRGLTCVHTFHGVTIWDDKLPDGEAGRKMMTALQRSLSEVAPLCDEAEWVYLTCQPSDDCYALDMAETVQRFTPHRGMALAYRKGYIMDYTSKRVREYDPETMSPFATLVFPKFDFCDPNAHYRYIGPFKSHEYVKDYFKVTWLVDRGFMVGTHGENISTVWNHPYAKREIEGPALEGVWDKFAIAQSDPITFHRRARLYGRMAVNCLPRPMHDMVRWGYNLLRRKYYARK